MIDLYFSGEFKSQDRNYTLDDVNLRGAYLAETCEFEGDPDEIGVCIEMKYATEYDFNPGDILYVMVTYVVEKYYWAQYITDRQHVFVSLVEPTPDNLVKHCRELNYHYRSNWVVADNKKNKVKEQPVPHELILKKVHAACAKSMKEHIDDISIAHDVEAGSGVEYQDSKIFRFKLKDHQYSKDVGNGITIVD